VEEVVFETRNLTNLQRIALMERLWEELSAEDSAMEPPAWHQEVLDSREEEWKNRDANSETIDEAWASLQQMRLMHKSAS
jgi:hypothetical protein